MIASCHLNRCVFAELLPLSLVLLDNRFQAYGLGRQLHEWWSLWSGAGESISVTCRRNEPNHYGLR